MNGEIYSKAREFLEKIKPTDKVAILTHDDLDGVCSGILYYEAIEKKTKNIEIFFYTYNAEKKPMNLSEFDFIFIADLAPSFLQEIFLEIKNKKVFYTDHHEKNEKVPENFLEIRTNSGICSSRTIYEIFGGRKWIAVCGVLGDAGDRSKENDLFLKEFYEKEKTNFNEFSQNYVYRFGKLLIYFVKDIRKAFELLKSLQSYKEIKKVEEFILPVEEEVKRMLLEYSEKKEVINGINVFIVNPKYGIKSDLINKISFAEEKGIFVFLTPFNNTYRISYRNQSREFNGITLLKAAGVEDAGGHKMACGGSIKKDFLEQFKKNLAKIDLEKCKD